MKRILYIMCAVLIAALASCNHEEIKEDDDSDTQLVTIEGTIADWDTTRGSAATQTRAASSADRYFIEVYEQADYTVAANVFSDGTNKATSTTGSFSMPLEKGKSYYCLFWADNKADGAAAYIATDLKNVSLVSGTSPTEAFHGTLKVDGKSTTYSVSLHRAVANIVLKETGTLPAGTVTMKFSQPTVFDVSTAAPKGAATQRTETLTLDADITGTKDSPATLHPSQPIVVLAPVASATETTFTFQYEDEEEFEVKDAKVQANYNTNITGHYTEN